MKKAPHLTLQVQPVKVKLKVGGRGKPTFRTLESDVVPRISYRNPKAVNAFLADHPEIEDFLEVAWPVLVRCFKGPVDVVLEVMTYSEETIYQELVGWIQSTDDVYEGLEKLERFEEEWFLDHMAKVGNKFNFNIESK